MPGHGSCVLKSNDIENVSSKMQFTAKCFFLQWYGQVEPGQLDRIIPLCNYYKTPMRETYIFSVSLFNENRMFWRASLNISPYTTIYIPIHAYIYPHTRLYISHTRLYIPIHAYIYPHTSLYISPYPPICIPYTHRYIPYLSIYIPCPPIYNTPIGVLYMAGNLTSLFC